MPRYQHSRRAPDSIGDALITLGLMLAAWLLSLLLAALFVV